MSTSEALIRNHLQAFFHLLQKPGDGYIYILRQHLHEFNHEDIDRIFLAIYERVKTNDRVLAQRYRTGEQCDAANEAEKEFRSLQKWFTTVQNKTELATYTVKIINSRLTQLYPPRPSQSSPAMTQLELDALLAMQLQNE